MAEGLFQAFGSTAVPLWKALPAKTLGMN